MQRKGFPESYDQRLLLRFLADVKAGVRSVCGPVYSHLHYDIVPGAQQCVQQPDIVILEGLNVLQSPDGGRDGSRLFVSDFFDFSHLPGRRGDHHRAMVRRAIPAPL